jgi:hypothetical protein
MVCCLISMVAAILLRERSRQDVSVEYEDVPDRHAIPSTVRA